MVSWKNTNKLSCIILFMVIIVFGLLIVGILVFYNIGYIYPDSIVNVYNLPKLNDTYSFDMRCDLLYEYGFIDTLLKKCNVNKLIANPSTQSLCIITPYIRGIMNCPSYYLPVTYPVKRNDLSFNRPMFIFCICIILTFIFSMLSILFTFKLCCCTRKSV